MIDAASLATNDALHVWLPARYERHEIRYTSWARQYLAAVGMLAVVLVAFVVIAILVPFSQNSLLSFVFGGNPNSGAGGIGWVGYAILAVIAIPLLRPKFIWKAARDEEIRYRKGSEDWTFARRARSCVFFGLIHFWNLIVPLALAFAMILGGVYLMAIYLRAYRRAHRDAPLVPDGVYVHYAVESSTRAHVAYNRVALTLIAIAIIATLATQ